MSETDTTQAATPETVVKTMSYQDLRRMAECAASYREGRVWIVIGKDGWKVETTEPRDTDGKAVIPCDNGLGKKRKRTPRLKNAGIRAAGMKEAVDLLDLKDRHGNALGPADAVFWTAAAVEKFVVPYYASVYGNEAPEKLARIISVLGIVREPSGGAGSPGGEEAEEREGAEMTGPFALAHMPKSEYVQVDDGALAVLVQRRTSHVAVPISDYPLAEEVE